MRELANLVVNWHARFGERRTQFIHSIQDKANVDQVSRGNVDTRLRESIATARQQKQKLNLEREQRRMASVDLAQQSLVAAGAALAGGLVLLGVVILAMVRRVASRIRT